MTLSDLQTGECGTIIKVRGHGSFRKRIIEMGFVRGQMVEVLLNAPLQDPVKYKIMGYEVSLRHDEAALIEVQQGMTSATQLLQGKGVPDSSTDSRRQPDAVRPSSSPEAAGTHSPIDVAIVGNPNCGKTSLFNFASGAHGHVGNYSGVTVDATLAHASFGGYDFNLTDLPGTYSLSCYSPEELYVRKHLTEQHPDVVINVIDASNLERNLYLTTQLVDMDIRVVCALNMYDEFERRGDTLELQTLGTLLGVPMVPTSFKTGRGVKDLFAAVISAYEDRNTQMRHIHINYGHEIEHGIKAIQTILKENRHIRSHYSTRYLAIKLMEGDSDVKRLLKAETEKIEDGAEAYETILKARQHADRRIQEEIGVDAETAIMDAKYGFIHGALAEAEYHQGTVKDTYHMTHVLDDILSNKYFGFPIFFLLLFVMFQVTFSLGQYPMDWIEAGVEWLGEWVGSAMPEGPLRSMIVDGVVGGVGSVIVFLPQILILYFFISLMEDSGYMARAAFIMDKLMHRMGLHGKSFIPLIMGFGCNVPAVMTTRTIESRRSRLITMMILPFMSCSARLPIYIMIVGTFFSLQWRSTVLISLYLVGVLVAVLMSRIFSTLVIRGEDTPFVMELPPYRWPTPKAIARHTWDKGKEYLKKMGGVILVASIIVWALGYYGPSQQTVVTEATSMEQSFIGHIGHKIEPLFTPQGFNWKLDVSLVAGVGAKEIVASTIGVLYAGDASFSDDEAFSDDMVKYTRLRALMAQDGMTPVTAYAYLLFILLYFPCVATIVAIKNETGSWRWACFAAFYTTAVAWMVSALFYQLGQL